MALRLRKLADPNPLPPGVTDVAWAGTAGSYLAVGLNAAPWLAVYTRTGDVLEDPLTIPDIPTAAVQSVDWSPDGSVLAITWSHPVGQVGIRLWSRSGSTLTRLTDPTGSTFSNENWIRFSPDGAYLASIRAFSSGSKTMTLWPHSAGTLGTRNTENVRAGGNQVLCRFAWSPDSSLIFGGFTNEDSPWLVKNTAGVLSVMTPPADHLPSSGDKGFAWVSDGHAILSSQDAVSVYPRSGDTLTTPGDNLFAAGPAVAVRTQDGSVTVPFDAGRLHVLERSGTVLTDSDRDYDYDFGVGRSARWTSAGTYLAIAGVSGLDWYKPGPDTPPPLRQRQRDDGLANSGPRQAGSSRNPPTSKQRSIRQGWGNTYL